MNPRNADAGLDELGRFIHDLDRGTTLWDAGTLVACLLVAYGICWLTGRRRPSDSVLFGRGVIDGVLFPLLALTLTYSARPYKTESTGLLRPVSQQMPYATSRQANSVPASHSVVP